MLPYFICTLYMGERIAGKQDRSSLIIEDPLRAPKIPPKYTFFYILAHKWKTGFQIVAPCCTYVSTVMRSAFADILVPLVPLDFYVRAQHDPEIFFFFIYFFLTQKVLIRLLLYLTCKLLLNRGYMWTKMGPVWLFNPPPPPGPPYSQRCFHIYVKLIIHCFSLLCICIQCDEVFMTL